MNGLNICYNIVLYKNRHVILAEQFVHCFALFAFSLKFFNEPNSRIMSAHKCMCVGRCMYRCAGTSFSDTFQVDTHVCALKYCEMNERDGVFF